MHLGLKIQQQTMDDCLVRAHREFGPGSALRKIASAKQGLVVAFVARGGTGGSYAEKVVDREALKQEGRQNGKGGAE
jgi:hypothetical protein